jgi:DNA-binding transcriptional LysR family regulator
LLDRPAAQPKDRDVAATPAKSPVLVTNIKYGEVKLVGRLHHVAMVRNRPRTLGTWRVTTESPRTADRIAQVLRGHIQQNPTVDLTEVLTNSSTIDILLTEPTALYIGWQREDKNTCDGLSRDDRQVCICPADHELRRAAAKQGRGCRPRMSRVPWNFGGGPAVIRRHPPWRM